MVAYVAEFYSPPPPPSLNTPCRRGSLRGRLSDLPGSGQLGQGPALRQSGRLWRGRWKPGGTTVCWWIRRWWRGPRWWRSAAMAAMRTYMTGAAVEQLKIAPATTVQVLIAADVGATSSSLHTGLLLILPPSSLAFGKQILHRGKRWAVHRSSGGLSSARERGDQGVRKRLPLLFVVDNQNGSRSTRFEYLNEKGRQLPPPAPPDRGRNRLRGASRQKWLDSA